MNKSKLKETVCILSVTAGKKFLAKENTMGKSYSKKAETLRRKVKAHFSNNHVGAILNILSDVVEEDLTDVKAVENNVPVFTMIKVKNIPVRLIADGEYMVTYYTRNGVKLIPRDADIRDYIFKSHKDIKELLQLQGVHIVTDSSSINNFFDSIEDDALGLHFAAVETFMDAFIP